MKIKRENKFLYGYDNNYCYCVYKGIDENFHYSVFDRIKGTYIPVTKAMYQILNMLEAMY